MKRGDIFTAATGHGFGSKPRPVLVVQADEYLELSVILTAGVTGQIGLGSDLRPHIRMSATNGLKKDSDVMIDAILPVRRDKFGKYIGTLDPSDWARVERGLLAIFGISVA